MIKGLSYGILRTSDMEKSRRFFTEQLGLEIDEAQGATFSQFASNAGVPWAIMPATPDAAPKDIDLYFTVDDVDAAYAAWKDRGVDMVTEPHDEPFGRTFTFRDPDGRQLHVLTTAS